MTQTPEQKAQIEAQIAAKKQAEEAQQIADEKAAAERAEAERRAAEEKRIADEKAAEAKRLADAQAAEQVRQKVAQKQYDDMIRDITTGWNTATTDLTQNSDNEVKAFRLIYRYPEYIHSAPDNWIDVADALKSPWKYYGQIVKMSGYIYSIEQFPPGSEFAKTFPEGCYSAMLNAGDGYNPLSVSMIIIGSPDNIYNGDIVSVKGYIYGHAELVSGTGGRARGITFAGFQE